MWEKATDEALEQLVAISPSGLTFVGQKRSVGKLIGKMEHLACYFPGNIALGVAEGAVLGAKAAHYLEVAANLTYTCWQMYERTTSGEWWPTCWEWTACAAFCSSSARLCRFGAGRSVVRRQRGDAAQGRHEHAAPGGPGVPVLSLEGHRGAQVPRVGLEDVPGLPQALEGALWSICLRHGGHHPLAVLPARLTVS